MSLVVFQHADDEPPALLGDAMLGVGHRLRVVEMHREGAVPVDFDDVEGLIIMGGPQNVDQIDDSPWLQEEIDFVKQAYELGLPIVGVCLGAQVIAAALGGKVEPMEAPEVGWTTVKLAFPGTIDAIYAGIPWETTQFHLHGRQITELPKAATPLAGSKLARTQAFRAGLTTYGFQYHFEWNKAQLEHFARNELVTKAGANADEIVRDIETHYPNYRRWGKRLCERLALTVFPIDKRLALHAPL